MPGNLGEATDITSVGGTRDARFQIADKKDPNRVSVELLFAKLDPLGAGVYQTTEPRAWVYMKDGRTVYIRADRGRIRRSAGASGGAAPESGEFSGNGLVLVFPPRVATDESEARPIDPLSDVPGMIGHFDTASFDTVLLEVSSQDPWTVESEDLWAAGKGFVVRANQVLERLEFAKVSSGGQIRYRLQESKEPDVAAAAFVGPLFPPVVVAEIEESESGEPADMSAPPTGEPTSTASTQPTTTTEALLVGPPVPPATALAGKEDLYLAEFRDGVTLVQAGRTLRADLLSVWTRFIDNKLPEGALGAETVRQPARRVLGDVPRGAPAASPPMPLPAQLAALMLAQVADSRRLFSNSDTDVVLTWTGGMVARPLSTVDGAGPAELARGNHVHARFTATREGGESRVVLTDTETGAAGVCAALDYAATLRELALANGPGCERVDLTVPGAGRFVTPNVSMDLDTGVGRVAGSGTIVQLESDEDPSLVTVRPEHPALADPDAPLAEGLQRRITWSSGADFKFRARQGRMTDVLKSAAFEGDVVARDRASWLSGDRLAVDFIQTPRKKSSLSRMRVRGGNGEDQQAIAIGRSTRVDADTQFPVQDSFIAANEIEVRFAPSKLKPGDDDATRTIATGRVRVGDKKADLRAEWLDAQLMRKTRSDYEAGDVRAKGNIRIDMRASVSEKESVPGESTVVAAVADEMHADGQARWVDFIGEHVELSRGPSAVSGKQMHLQESDSSLQVFGPGAVRHLEISRDASEAARLALDTAALAPATDATSLPAGLTLLEASWSRSMTFSDRTGRVECHGDSTVTSTTSEGGQLARSERLFLDMTPSRERAPAAAAAPVVGADIAPGAVAMASGTPTSGASTMPGDADRARPAPAEDRRLLRAEAIGAALERDGGQPASVKSWKFAPAVANVPEPDLFGPPAAPPPREYDQVMYIEGPRIVVDEVAGTMTIPDAGRGVTFDRGKSTSSSSSLAGGSSGRSQFTWAGTMEFNRITGELRMRRDVELRHLPLDSSELVRMVCNDLTAFFDTRGGKDGSATLRTAEANGAVYAESGSRHLTADQLTFEAASSTATARSTSDSPVVMQDDRQAAPVLAKALRWETRTDRVDITEPMPITGAMTK